MAWVDCSRGFLMVSVYLRTGEGLSEGHVAILKRLKKVLQQAGLLWVCGGDFNVEPEDLKASLVHEEFGALIVEPQEPTHEQNGSWRKLSHFLMHRCLAGKLHGCKVDHSALKGGRRAVQLELNGVHPTARREGPQEEGAAPNARASRLQETTACVA